MDTTKHIQTENNHNQAFKDNERTIQKEFIKRNFLRDGYVSVKEIAKETGLARQTIYNHHSDIADTINQSEDFLFGEFASAQDNPEERIIKTIPDHNRRTFYIIMIFMREYKEVFEIICTDINNRGLLYRMVREAYPRLQIKWPRGSQAKEVSGEKGSMSVAMMVEVLSRWGIETKCDVGKAEHYINRLLDIVDMLVKNKLP